MAENTEELRERTRIKDVASAQELASIEKPGRDTALVRAKELERQGNTSLSKEERDNIEIMDHVLSKYPDAVTVLIGDSGKRILLEDASAEAVCGNSSAESFVRMYTQEGVFSVVTGANVRGGRGFASEDVNVDGFYSAVGSGGFEDLEVPLSGNPGEKCIPASSLFKDPSIFHANERGYGMVSPDISKVDLGNPKTREVVSESLHLHQSIGEGNKKKMGEMEVRTSVGAIKAEL